MRLADPPGKTWRNKNSEPKVKQLRTKMEKHTNHTRSNVRVKRLLLAFFTLIICLSLYIFNAKSKKLATGEILKDFHNECPNKLSEKQVESLKAVTKDHNIDINPLYRAPTMHPNSSEVLRTGEHGALSSDLELCNELTYKKIIDKYGMENVNSADLAVPLGLCIGMVNFFNSGIGGGGYAVYTDTTRNNENNEWFDFRETCPLAWDNDVHNLTKVGGMSVGVPGEIMGLYELHHQKGLGKVTWSQLLDPIIELGQTGWSVGPVLGAALSIYEDYFNNNYDSWSFVFNKDKSLKKSGDWIQRPTLSAMFQELANNGSVAPFYDPEHWIVKSMVKSVQKAGGLLTGQDFANYKVMQGKPLSTTITTENLFQYDVQTVGGSSSGAALIAGLNIMKSFPYRVGGDYMKESVYELVETMKWMASSRSRLGDYFLESTDNDTNNYPQRILDVLSDSWRINATHKMRENYLHTFDDFHEYDPKYEMNDPHGTAHFSIVDSHNGAVSLTTTINLLFGSLVHDPVTGVIFNNEMDDFSDPHGQSNAFDLKPSIYNLPEPGKRPLSSTVPTVIIDELGRPDLVIGASGGSRIMTSVFQTIVRNYWYGMPLLESIAYPRVHHQLLPNQLEVESKSMIGSTTIKQLQEIGYTDIVETHPKSVVNAIKRDRISTLHAVSDYWRKRGISVAF